MMQYRLVNGNHFCKGIRYKVGDVLDSELPLDKLFSGKFKKVKDQVERIQEDTSTSLVWEGENLIPRNYGTDTVNVFIPTHLVSRFPFLKKCVNSILKGSYKKVKVTVGVNGNKELLELVKTLPVEIYFCEKNLGWIRMANKLCVLNEFDLVVYCADDVEFEPECITNAVNTMKERFPDGDGLVSIHQRNLSWGLDTAFGMMGKKFIERFPDAPFCVDYGHGCSDHELGDYAKLIGRHFHCMDAGLHHNRMKDESQEQANKIIHKDLPIFKERKKRGLVWGKNFDLINKEIQKPLNILFSCDLFTNLSGGPMSRYTLGKGLKSLGHDVFIIANNYLGEIVEKSKEAGIFVYTKKTIPKDKKFDIIVLSQATQFAYLLDDYPGVPVISVSHSKVFDVDKPLVDDRVCHYVFCRDDVLVYWAEKCNIPLEKCSTIRSSIDFERFSKNEKGKEIDPKFILFVGTIGILREKVLHDIAKKAEKRGMVVKVVGEGAFCDSVWEKNVQFYPPTWDVEKWVHECTETVGVYFGRTTIEGWVCGKPGWVYDVDERGNIKSCNKYMPSENVRKFDVKFIAQKARALYGRYLIPLQKVKRDNENITFVIAVNNEELLKSTALVSPIFKEGSSHEVLLKRGFGSAGEAYNEGIKEAKNNIMVFMHQDVFLPEGWDTRLFQIVEELDRVDPDWGVLGCVGVTKELKTEGHVYCNVFKIIIGRKTPIVQVRVLDESLLVIKKDKGLLFDSAIPGFTVYGLDLCLNSNNRGLTNYVMDNFYIHNTVPYKYPPIFWDSIEIIRKKWKKELPIQTTYSTLLEKDEDMEKDKRKCIEVANLRKSEYIKDLPLFMKQLKVGI
jgi:hypothetical protein